MGLFTKSEMSKINNAAKKSNSSLKSATKPKRSKKNAKALIDDMSEKVEEYFKDSEAILITSKEELHQYIDKCIEVGYCAIDTETTGLDRINDTIVGFSLYYPGGHECYVPNKHLIYIFDEPYKDQLTYEESGEELQRLVDAKVKVIFANADYDLAMIYKDFNVDMCDVCYYDVILAWRCLKENELKNGLKELYSKYVLKGKGDPMKFSDFFSVDLFPYCKPRVAKLYAANDAKITYELFRWQLPYVLPNNSKCKKNHLENIADLIWNLEFPMIKVCAMMHRNGIYFDFRVAEKVAVRYHNKFNEEIADLKSMIQDLINDMDTPNNPKRPFKTGQDFNPTSPKHVQYLCYDLLKLPDVGGNKSTDKGILRDFGLPQTDRILSVRSLSVLINSFVDKLTAVAGQSDGRIHPQFKSVGASTGRMSCIAKDAIISSPSGDKLIQDMQIGDYVYCYDVNTNKLQISRIAGVYKTGIRRCVKIHWKSKYNPALSGTLTCTPDHFLRTQDGRWVMAQDLNPSDSLLYLHKENTEEDISDIFYACKIESLEGEYPVYDLCIEGYHNFIANELCVHNSSDPNCISEGTQITCVSGTRNIEDIVPGGLVYCVDEDTGDIKIRPVLNVWDKGIKGCVKIQCKGLYSNYETELVLTPDHKLFTQDKEYVCAEKLKPGDVIRSLLGEYITVTCVESCGSRHVYDIEVEEHHNFFANSLCCKNCQNIPSHASDIRHMFRATARSYEDVDVSNKTEIVLKYYDKVDTGEGYILSSDLKPGSIIKTDEQDITVQNVSIQGENVYIGINN